MRQDSLVSTAHVSRGDVTVSWPRRHVQVRRAECPPKIASVLVHEVWHVGHGSNEAGVHAAQLSTLVALDAGPSNLLYSEVTARCRHDAALASIRRRRVAMSPRILAILTR